MIELEDVVKVPPSRLGDPVTEIFKNVLKDKYEGMVIEGIGYIILLVDYEFNPVGQISPGDGHSYHKVRVKVLSYYPEVNEVVEGRVVEVEEFGVFVRLVTTDALMHVSQITDDYMDYNSSQGILVGRQTKRIIQKNDWVRARVAAVSIGRGAMTDKIGLTARQPFLGKSEWIEEDIRKLAGEKPKQEAKA
ncbi:MAG: DNA-directed RNA polymerase [Thermoproteota archaeon]|nr:DNA-directed RNA polymerase [Candidatus Brockarchaeota archaeon]